VSLSDDRYRRLDAEDGSLTIEEMRDGWHFCPEFDLLLTQGEERDGDGRCAFCGFDAREVKP
jgi:hypothetical protein